MTQAAALQPAHARSRLVLQVVEPWLGKYDQLKATYGRWKRHEISAEEVLPRARPKNSERAIGARENAGIRQLSQTERARQNGINRDTQRKQDALARYAPDQFREVRAGRKSTDAAYKEAMGKEPPTPLEQVQKLLPKLAAGEVFQLAEMLLPFLTAAQKRKLKEMLE